MLYREEETKQQGAVGDCCRRHQSARSGVFDVAVYPIDRSGEERAQEKREKHPVLGCDIGGQRKEIKADVIAVEWVFAP